MNKLKRPFWGILLFLSFFSALFFFHLGLNLHRVQRLEDSLYALDQGFTYLFLQHESNPLELPHTAQTLEEFKRIFQQLHWIENAEYYELYMQPLETGEECFAFLGEAASSLRQLDCLQISANVLDGFSISMEQGERFQEEAYLQQQGRPIPAILGSDYRPYLKLGDSFSASYLFVPYSFEVCGFLKEDSKIIWSNGTILLDRAILIPSFEFSNPPGAEAEAVCQLIHWANKTSGKLKIQPEEEQRVSAQLEAILHNSPVGLYEWHSTNPDTADFFLGLNIRQTKGLMITASIICFLLSLFGVYTWAVHSSGRLSVRMKFFWITFLFLLAEGIIVAVPPFQGIRLRLSLWTIVFWPAWMTEALCIERICKRKG